MEKKLEPDLHHLEWAIDQRAKIQHTLLKLYQFLQTYNPDMQSPNSPWVRTSALDDLIAAGFSLWRAAFLAGSLRQLENIQEAQKQFLERVVTINAITFSDDKQNDAWTFGYYILNAMYRLLASQRNLEMFLSEEDKALLARLLRIRATGNRAHNRHQWESLHAVLRIFYKIVTGDQILTPEPPAPIPGDPFYS
jgi:hypothetical protein